MCFLLFQIGKNQHALEIDLVEAIVPLVALTPLTGAPQGVSGTFVYRGNKVPVIDPSQMQGSKKISSLLSTRIVLLHYPKTALLGIIGEKMTEIISEEELAKTSRIDLHEFLPPAIHTFLLSLS